jgi:hypothetical protein
MVPGMPLELSDLGASGLAMVGIVTWIIGLDLLLVSLGLSVKNRVAKYVAIVFFALAAYFDFVQFLLKGLSGAMFSVIGLALNITIVYFLFKTEVIAEKQLTIDSHAPIISTNLQAIETKTATFKDLAELEQLEYSKIEPFAGDEIKHDLKPPPKPESLKRVVREKLEVEHVDQYNIDAAIYRMQQLKAIRRQLDEEQEMLKKEIEERASLCEKEIEVIESNIKRMKTTLNQADHKDLAKKKVAEELKTEG